MRWKQAVYTSLPRLGKSGYHVVARSAGVTESAAAALAAWCPSHGALVVDAWNRASINFHPLPGGLLALSRTCLGPAEYSGRGGPQLYTHALIFPARALLEAGGQVLSLYHNALAQGLLRYQPDPPRALDALELGSLAPRRDARAWSARARALGLPDLEPWRARLVTGQSVTLAYEGDRAALAECLLGVLPPPAIAETSFTTGLQPSVVRPFRLTLVGAAPR
jgi:hypothetical protein